MILLSLTEHSVADDGNSAAGSPLRFHLEAIIVARTLVLLSDDDFFLAGAGAGAERGTAAVRLGGGCGAAATRASFFLVSLTAAFAG